MTDHPDLTPEEAIERFLAARSVDSSDSTLSTYHYRLDLFRQWAADEGVDAVGDIDPWDVEAFQSKRRATVSPATAKNEATTLRLFLRWCARKGLVDDAVPAAVDVPNPSRKDMVDETRLESDRAEALLNHYHAAAPTRAEAVLSVLWYVGCRMGALRGLDVRDWDASEGALWFRHRPETGTPLKNGRNGERVVSLPSQGAEAVRRWVDTREDVRDDNGRVPLVPSERGRPHLSTVRDWVYRLTLPCVHSGCPHGKDPETCDWTAYQEASKCPSSRSPHQVRTGSITWQLNRGVPPEVVAERVNADVSTIKQHYDQADPLREMRQRRSSHIDKLDMETNDE